MYIYSSRLQDYEKKKFERKKFLKIDMEHTTVESLNKREMIKQI